MPADRPTILSAAVTGAFGTPEQNPNLPVSPEEIAHACISSAEAGAAICHVHVRELDTARPSMNLDYYREVMKRIADDGSDLIVNLTTGPGGRYFPRDDDPAKPAPGTMLTTPEIRTEHIIELKPEVCTLDLNTQWFGGGAVINSPRSIRIMAERIYASGVKPELEVFNVGDIALAHDLIADGTLKTPALFQIVTGINYGFPSNTETMAYAVSQLPKDCQWAAFGASRHAFTMLAQSYILGGHCRIGMEDTLYISRGQKTAGNHELVEKAVRIIRDLGGEIATPAQARELLGIAARRA